MLIRNYVTRFEKRSDEQSHGHVGGDEERIHQQYHVEVYVT